MDATHTGRVDTLTQEKLARTAAAVVGAAFLVVGIAGFIPGITTSYSDLTFAGHHSDAKLLGLFEVSVLHLLFGVAGLAMARSGIAAVRYLIYGGVIYLVLWIYGLVIDRASSANFVPVNTADNWLHLVLGLAMVALGVAGHRAIRGAIGSQSPM